MVAASIGIEIAEGDADQFARRRIDDRSAAEARSGIAFEGKGGLDDAGFAARSDETRSAASIVPRASRSSPMRPDHRR